MGAKDVVPWQSICLAHPRPWVRSLGLQKLKTTKHTKTAAKEITYWFPVVECFITVRDVAEESGTQSC